MWTAAVCWGPRRIRACVRSGELRTEPAHDGKRGSAGTTGNTAVRARSRRQRRDRAGPCFGVPALTELEACLTDLPETKLTLRDGLKKTENPRVGGSIPPLGTSSEGLAIPARPACLEIRSSPVVSDALAMQSPRTARACNSRRWLSSSGESLP
jgi:hypothetical protein